MAAPDSFCPYVGLQPYREDDREYFFGRERDARIISANLYAAPLTVLYGASGVGKSSVLLAGVVPHLRSAPRTAVVVFRQWQDASFLSALKSECLNAVQRVKQAPLAIDLALPFDDFLSAAAQAFGGSLLILLDQFEEYFLYHQESETEQLFDTEFARAVNREDIDASFLVSLREEALSKLNHFRTRIPNLLGNTLRLQHLDAVAADTAIRKPLDVYNTRFSAAMRIEDELVDTILMQVRTGQVLLSQSAGVGQLQTDGEAAQIETPFLQLVMTRLWHEEVKEDSRVLRRSTLDRLGGAQEIVRAHLDSVMEKLDATEREVCARFFDRLVTPSGNKIAYAVDDLTRYAGDLAERVPGVLKILADAKTLVLRSVDPPPNRPGVRRYEIFHDVLAPAVLNWRARYVQAQQRAEAERRADEQQRRAEEQARVAARLRRLSRGLAVILVVVLGAAALAWLQATRAEKAGAEAVAAKADAVAARRKSEEQARLATARYLVAKSRQHLDDQLDVALLLGVEATRLTSAAEARGSLLDGLLYNPFLSAFLHGHTDQVQSVALSPDGKTLASGGRDHTIILWDVATRQPLGRPLTSHDWTSSVAFSPDGKTLASGSCGKLDHQRCKEGEIRLWDVTSRQMLGSPLAAHTDRVYGVAFSPDGRTLASGSCGKRGDDDSCKQGEIRLWNVTTQLPQGEPLAGHTDTVTSVAFAPDGNTLASGSSDDTTILWDTATKTPLGEPLRGHTSSVRSVAFSPDGNNLATGSDDQSIIVWDVATHEARGKPLSARSYVNDVAFSPDGQTLVGAYADNTLILWNVATSNRHGPPLFGHRGWVNGVAFSRDGQTVVSASDDGALIMWNLTAGLRGHTDSVQSMAFSPDGKTLASGSCGRREDNHCRQGEIRLWDFTTREPLGRPLHAHTDAVTSLAFTLDGKTLASGGCGKSEDSHCAQGEIRLWDVTTGQPLGPPLHAHTDAVMSLAFTPDGKTLASGGGEGTIALWDLLTHRALGEISAGENSVLFAVSFSPDGKTFAAGGAETHVLWDVATRQPFGQPSADLGAGLGSVLSVAFSPDGRMLALGTDNDFIILWDTADHKPLGKALRGHTDMVTQVAFSPDGKTLASGSADRTIILWDVATHQALGRPLTTHNTVNGVAFSPDGKTLATTNAGATIVLRDVEFLSDPHIESWQARACRIANRNLTGAEWAQYMGAEPYRATCPDLPLDFRAPATAAR